MNSYLLKTYPGDRKEKNTSYDSGEDDFEIVVDLLQQCINHRTPAILYFNGEEVGRVCDDWEDPENHDKFDYE